MKLTKITRLINLFMILFGVLFLFFLVWYDINPSGQRVVKHNFTKTNNLVRGPYPVDRLVEQKNVDGDFWEVAIDPVYFDLYIPRLYQSITFTSIFKLTNNQTVIELGGLGSDQGWQITLKPAYNGYLENLNLTCRIFVDDLSQISVCAGRESLPTDITTWSEIFDLYPDAEYVTYFLPLTQHFATADRLDNLKIKQWENSFIASDFDFLITSYVPVEDVGDGWKKASAIFLPNELWLAGHIYKFVLSAPDLSNHAKTIKLREVEFYLQKEPITRNNFSDKLVRFWQRFKLRF